MSYLFILLSLIGTHLNARQNKHGFLFWIVANAGLALHNYTIGEYGQAGLFAVFFGYAIYGWRQWARKGANGG